MDAERKEKLKPGLIPHRRCPKCGYVELWYSDGLVVCATRGCYYRLEVKLGGANDQANPV